MAKGPLDEWVEVEKSKKKREVKPASVRKLKETRDVYALKDTLRKQYSNHYKGEPLHSGFEMKLFLIFRESPEVAGKMVDNATVFLDALGGDYLKFFTSIRNIAEDGGAELAEDFVDASYWLLKNEPASHYDWDLSCKGKNYSKKSEMNADEFLGLVEFIRVNASSYSQYSGTEEFFEKIPGMKEESRKKLIRAYK